MDDPVTAYDRIAPHFRELAERRSRYLERVDELVVSCTPPGSLSLLDVGAGDGRRARKIAEQAGLSSVTLLEPSAEMQKSGRAAGDFRTLRAEQLDLLSGEFDVVTCLWNVLGHIFPASARVETLRQFARLVSPAGCIMLDVTHRYNAAEYGVTKTAGRFLLDTVRPSESNGDVMAKWRFAGAEFEVKGHVFTDGEFRAMSAGAGLIVEKRFVIDYSTGKLKRRSQGGNLFYVLSADPRRAARSGGHL